MLFIQLILQEWKKGIRAQGFYKNLAVSILLSIFGLYITGILLFLGFSLDELLEKANNTLNPTELMNGAMLYIMLISIAVRFFMQQLNTFNLPPYQVLPVKRSALINFLLLKPLTNPANYFFLLVIVPFVIQSTTHYYNAQVAIRFVVAFTMVVWSDSLLTAFLKRKFGSGLLSFLVVVAVLGGIGALEFFNIFSLFDFSRSLFGFIVTKPIGPLLPASMVGIAYLLNRWFFSQNYYPEKFNQKIKTDKTINADLSFLERFGVIGDLISVELKLILRHKRTKSMLYMSGFFLFYGLIFYPQKAYQHQMGMLFFVAMFITGLMMIMYGQWSISWDSRHFDSILTRNIPVKTYIESNYYLMISFTIISFVLSTPYFLFGPKIILMHLAAFLYNAGVNVYLLLFFATFNNKKVDLSRSSAMNYQGTTYKSFLIALPILFIPMVLVGGLSFFISLYLILGIISALGVVGILFRKPLINICINQFNRRKYKLAEGFRESE